MVYGYQEMQNKLPGLRLPCLLPCRRQSGCVWAPSHDFEYELPGSTRASFLWRPYMANLTAQMHNW